MILEAILNIVSVGKQNYEIMIDDLCIFLCKESVLYCIARRRGVEVMQKSMRKFCAFKDCSDCLTKISTLEEYIRGILCTNYTILASYPCFQNAWVQSSITSSLHMCQSYGYV